MKTPETVTADQLKLFIQSVRLGQDPKLMILFAHYLYEEHKNKEFVDEAIKLALEAESAALKLLNLGYPGGAKDIGQCMVLDGYPSKEKIEPQKSYEWLKLAASKGDIDAAKQLDSDFECRFLIPIFALLFRYRWLIAGLSRMGLQRRGMHWQMSAWKMSCEDITCSKCPSISFGGVMRCRQFQKLKVRCADESQILNLAICQSEKGRAVADFSGAG